MKAKPYYNTLSLEHRSGRLENTTGNSNKYYEIYTIPVSEASIGTPGKVNIVARHGRIGTEGRALLLLENTTHNSATSYRLKLYTKKRQRGYRDVTTAHRGFLSATIRVDSKVPTTPPSSIPIQKKRKKVISRLDLID